MGCLGEQTIASVPPYGVRCRVAAVAGRMCTSDSAHPHAPDDEKLRVEAQSTPPASEGLVFHAIIPSALTATWRRRRDVASKGKSAGNFWPGAPG